MDFQHRPGGKTGSGGVASASESNRDRRERLRQLALETIDINKDPYFMKNHLGSYECKLCLTLHNNEGSYLAHTQGKKHQTNLARRAAKEAKEAPAQPAPEKVKVEVKKFVKIGRPGYKVTKQRDPETGQQSLLFQIDYPEIAESIMPRHRFMSAYEQRIEPPDRRWQYLLMAAEPYETIAFKVPSREIDKAEGKFWTHWNRETKQGPCKGTVLGPKPPSSPGGIHGRVSLVPVQWEAQVKLRFQLLFQAEVGRALGELQAAVMLFYLGRREGSGHPQELLLTGPGLARDQRLCLSRDTQYLALAAAAASVTRSAERLRFSASLAIHGGEGGAPLPRTEVQQLLFGSDDKCFTRMTPVLLLLAKSRQQEEEEEEEEALAPSSYLSAEGVVDTAPYPQLSPAQAGTEELPTPPTLSQANASSPAPGGSAQFLAILTQFIRQLLNSSSEPHPQPSAHHWLDFEVMETLPHQLLNLRDIPAFQANAALFQHLLTFCYYPAEPGQAEAAERGPGPRKLRTLLLLKALQSVRARWQEHRKVQRQNRSARHQAHCRLQELTIDLRDRHFIVMPTAYVANNCEGPCRLPLSSRISSYFSHTVLLLDVQERGSPLRRAPCCVPVRYSDQLIISLSSDGLEIRKFPNMVAEECGCR
ncbi:hypothetical protein Nmel_018155 [Mimus melanotis]